MPWFFIYFLNLFKLWKHNERLIKTPLVVIVEKK